MATILQKLRVLFKANLHEVADKAIQKSDLAVYDEYIRQAERDLEEFRRTIAPMFAQVKTTKRRRENLANKAAQLDFAVDEFLRQGKKTEAMVTQKQLLSTLDLFSVWSYLVLGAGVMYVFGLTKRGAMLVVIPVWLLWVLVSLVGTRMGGF